MKENNLPEIIYTLDEGDTFEFFLDPQKHPITYQRKKHELIHSSGMTEQEAGLFIATTPFVLELAYEQDKGLFMVEAEAIESCHITNPYSGRLIPNENHPYQEEDPIKFLDTTILELTNMEGDLRTQVQQKHNFTIRHEQMLEDGIAAVEEAVSVLNDIDLTQERQRYNDCQK